MSYKVIYHGSEIILAEPTYHHVNSNKGNDYGLGFYCTQDMEAAKEWANKTTRSGFVNKYRFDDRGLKILDLTDKTKYGVLNWIAILMRNRYISVNDRADFEEELSFLTKFCIDVEEYDVVIGYRADDAYFRFPMMFVKNALTFEKLEEIYTLGNLGKQYVLISEKAFKRLKFVEAISVEPSFYGRYHHRKEAADNSYRELERLEKENKGRRIRDLMREYHD